MQPEPLGKYMTVEEAHEDGVRQWFIRNKRWGNVLARVVYYPPWRQYVMEPAGSGLVFNNQCLRDVARFLDSRADAA